MNNLWLILWGIGLYLQFTGHKFSLGGMLKLVWGDRLSALYFMIVTVGAYNEYYTTEDFKYPYIAIVTALLTLTFIIREHKNRPILHKMLDEELENS